jgi:hypothetical protein
MEHATNITYPRNATGSLAFEELISHELSHHWWGNLITCETQEDMWINEGMATYSGYLFYEWQYGKESALAKIKAKHDDLLRNLHINEGFRPISGVPHELTYGDHVYKKGADVAHTLRGYMGDSVFFKACRYVMTQKSYQSINTNELRDLMQTSSGQNLQNFFNNWIFSGGWSHFDLDSVRYFPDASGCKAIIGIRQKLYGASTLHTGVPLELSFFNPGWGRVVQSVTVSGQSQTFTLNLPYVPVYSALNFDTRINDASSHEYKTIKSSGNANYSLGKALVMVQNKGADSSLLRVVHHYVRPDDFKQNTKGHLISDQHYWTIDGILSPGFSAKLRLIYDGNKSTGSSNGYLDTLLTRVNGDSVGLFYRKDAGSEWQWLRKATKFKYNQKNGFLEVDSLRLGQYSFANVGDTTAIPDNLNGVVAGNGISVYPNPAGKDCTVNLPAGHDADYFFRLHDVQGKLVLHKVLRSEKNVIELSSLPKGAYIVTIETGTKVSHSQKLILD